MAGRGPVPEPTSLTLLKDNAKRKTIRGWTPALAPIDLAPPPDLDGDARAAWDCLVPVLREAGVLTVVDRPVMTAIAYLWSDWLAVRRVIGKEGAVLVRRGRSEPHPLLQASMKLLPLVRLFLAEVGATPQSRPRIKVDPPAQPSRIDAFREKHGG